MADVPVLGGSAGAEMLAHAQDAFSRIFTVNFQQMKERLSGLYTFDSELAKHRYKRYDILSSEDETDTDKIRTLSDSNGMVADRGAATVGSEMSYDKSRWMFPQILDYTKRWDEWDEEFLGALGNPASDIQANMQRAVARKTDRFLLAGVIANVIQGEFPGMDRTGTPVSPATFSSDQIVPINYTFNNGINGTGSDSPLTLEKLQRAASIFADNEVVGQDVDMDPNYKPVIILSQDDLNVMIGQLKVGSSDYNNAKPLVDGRIDTFLGFRFLRLAKSMLPGYNTGTRSLMCWVPRAIRYYHGGMKVNLDVDFTHNHRLQLRMRWRTGVCRELDKGVVKINVKES